MPNNGTAAIYKHNYGVEKILLAHEMCQETHYHHFVSQKQLIHHFLTQKLGKRSILSPKNVIPIYLRNNRGK